MIVLRQESRAAQSCGPLVASAKKYSIVSMKENKANLADWSKSLDINSINEQFSSPAWIISEKQLIDNVNTYAKFTEDKSRIFYPVKTNPSLTVLQLLAKLGTGADCASQLEINLALLSGIKLKNISYNTPVQDIQICESLLKSGANVVMDDINAIIELQKSFTNISYEGKLFLRVNLSEYVGYAMQNENQELMAHGHKSSKFGIPVEDLDKVIKLISIPISGLHVHVGTQMDNMKSFEYAISSLNDLAEKLNTLGHLITDINLGGGLGIPFDSNQAFPSLEAWCHNMTPLKKEHLNYSVEPGHAIIGNAVSLLTTVQTVKESRGKKWVIVDVGTDQLTKVTLLKWPHRILNQSGQELQVGDDAIAGPLCFAGDTLKENINAGDLKKGDPLLITEAGAYTFSLSNKFNGRTAPKWLLINSNNDLLQTMEKESVFDELHHSKYDWNSTDDSVSSQSIDLKLIKLISSNYLFKTCEADSFEYIEVTYESQNHYRFTVLTTSLVDFISMPFVIRIFGDASIISVLHSKGIQEKKNPVWGRKLSMDFYEQLPSNQKFEFTILLSNPIVKGSQLVIVARFKSSCNKCSGSLIISYE
jgi:diaminopimelate decarboxylase